MIQKMQSSKPPAKYACTDCDRNLPKNEPINVLFDDSVPSKKLKAIESKLTQAINPLDKTKELKKVAELENIKLRREKQMLEEFRAPEAHIVQIEESNQKESIISKLQEEREEALRHAERLREENEEAMRRLRAKETQNLLVQSELRRLQEEKELVNVHFARHVN